ncbi:MAG: hypothetical protein WC694_02520 [Candidatus Paceibacterota bacterium]|jgi:hypothetical protein
MIYFSKCKIQYPHDFDDFSCKKCNAFLIITGSGLVIKGKKVNRNNIFSIFIAMILHFKTFLG